MDTLQKFYDDFDKTVQKAKKEMDGVKIQLKEDETDVICEKCGRKMVVKVGRYGKFLACPGYPECKNVKKIVQRHRSRVPQVRREDHPAASPRRAGFSMVAASIPSATLSPGIRRPRRSALSAARR